MRYVPCANCGKRTTDTKDECSVCGKPWRGASAASASSGGSTASSGRPAAPPPPIPTHPSGGGWPGAGGAPFPPAPIVPATPVTPAPTTSAWPAARTVSPPAPLPAAVLTRWGSPTVEGVMADDLEKIEVEKGMSGLDMGLLGLKGLIGCLLLPFRPLIVLSALLFGGKRPKEKTTHYVARLECADGSFCEARFERELRGARMSVGDYISVWGSMRAGVVVASHAYNHSVRAEIL